MDRNSALERLGGCSLHLTPKGLFAHPLLKFIHSFIQLFIEHMLVPNAISECLGPDGSHNRPLTE